jgi:hypothetical protein
MTTTADRIIWARTEDEAFDLVADWEIPVLDETIPPSDGMLPFRVVDLIEEETRLFGVDPDSRIWGAILVAGTLAVIAADLLRKIVRR